MYMEAQELKRYYKRHFGKRNTLLAYELLDDEKTLITLLISAYNCYAIKHSKKDERYALSLITNPDYLFFEDCEKRQFINEFENYIIETVESKYLYKDGENNGCQDN